MPEPPTRSERELYCAACGNAAPCSPSVQLAHLQAAGLMRRAHQPDPVLLAELIRNALPKLRCQACGGHGLILRTAVDDLWAEPPCAQCGRPISAERREALPRTTCCAACAAAPAAIDAAEREFCPRCGEVLELRVARDGISRYVFRCPSCRS